MVKIGKLVEVKYLSPYQVSCLWLPWIPLKTFTKSKVCLFGLGDVMQGILHTGDVRETVHGRGDVFTRYIK